MSGVSQSRSQAWMSWDNGATLGWWLLAQPHLVSHAQTSNRRGSGRRRRRVSGGGMHHACQAQGHRKCCAHHAGLLTHCKVYQYNNVSAVQKAQAP